MQNFFDVKIKAPHFWNRLKHHKVLIKLRKNIPAGEFEKRLQIATNRSYQPDVSIILTGRVMGLVETEPQAISLGVLEPSLKVSRELRIYSPYARPFVIKSISNPFPDNLRIEYVPERADKQHTVKVNVIKTFPPGKISGRLKIVAGFDKEKEYTLSTGLFGIQKNNEVL